MNICFELSKEYTILPLQEIKSILSAEKIDYHNITENPDVFIISITNSKPVIYTMACRLSHSYHINEHLFTSLPLIEHLKKMATAHPITEKGSIAIKCRNRSKNIRSKPIIQALAAIYTKNRTVSLTHSDIEIRVIITDDACYVGRQLIKIDRTQFQKRKPQYRPFFSPISMAPLLARLLVNLSQVPTKARLLDPCCGTGGILIEAGLMGITVLGCDLKQKMISGTKQNLNHYNITPTLLTTGDIGDLSMIITDPVDAIVTDFPYGKATSTNGEKIQSLYQRACTQISRVLKTGSYAVIGVPDDQLSTNNATSLVKQSVYPIRVHRSLTRYFIIYQKQ